MTTPLKLRQDEALVGGVKWNEIRKILAFKRDMVTSDLVCLSFSSWARMRSSR